MNVYNLTQDEVFNIDKGNSTKNIDFNLDSNNEFAIYDSNNYNNVRPIFKEFMEDYSIEQNKDDFNREIELQKIREQNEIMKNYGEISITSDPRITKYRDTYSVTPYSDFKVMNTTEADSDIVKSLDHCKGEWVDVDKCNPNKPCKRILQEYIIQNPNYTGDHCRVDRERVRDGDTRMVYCDQYNTCNGHGRCEGYDICTCDEGYSGPNCDNICLNTNCNNGVAVPPDCNCSCNSGYSGINCDVCDNIDCSNGGTFNANSCKCDCINGFTGDTCNILPDKCEHPVKIDCHNGSCIEGTCSCEDGYTGDRCQTKQLCSDIIPKYCGENGKVIGNIPDGCSCVCDSGYSGDTCNIPPNKCEHPVKINCNNGTCKEGTCNCDDGYTGSNCETKLLCNDIIPNYCGENGKVIGNIPDGCSCVCDSGYSGDRCENINKCNIPCINGKVSGYAGNCECFCDPGYIGSSCDTYNCDMLKDELNKYNLFTNLNHKVIYFSNNDKTIRFDLNNTTMTPPQYIEQINTLIEQDFIEKMLDCYKPTEIIIHISYLEYYVFIENIIMEIFDRISNYNNGEYLKNIEIYDISFTYYNTIKEISTKYYSKYKGKLRDISSDNILEFTKIPMVRSSIMYNESTFIKPNCPFAKKLSEFSNEQKNVIYRIFPLEYFSDCIQK